MTTHICTWDGPEPSESDTLRRVVVQHIADSLASGSDAAEALARSLITELDAAGLDITTDVNHLLDTLADEQRTAGA